MQMPPNQPREESITLHSYSGQLRFARIHQDQLVIKTRSIDRETEHAALANANFGRFDFI